MGRSGRQGWPRLAIMDLQICGVGSNAAQQDLTRTGGFHGQQFSYECEYPSKAFRPCSLKRRESLESLSGAQFRLAGHLEMPEAGSMARTQGRAVPEYSDFQFDSSLDVVQHVEEGKMGQGATWEEERSSNNAQHLAGNRGLYVVIALVKKGNVLD